MLEEWEDQESLDLHNKNENVQKIVQELKKLRESSEINLYREVE
jgi:quinol monooxygenase YgiN